MYNLKNLSPQELELIRHGITVEIDIMDDTILDDFWMDKDKETINRDELLNMREVARTRIDRLMTLIRLDEKLNHVHEDFRI